MQLNLLLFPMIVVGSLCLCVNASAQTGGEADSLRVTKDPIKINILGSYYEQDGIHSPVTGGTGTEYLTNIAPSIGVIYPLDSIRTLMLDAAIDFYSSASSDNINNPYLDPKHVSSASAHDARQYGTLTYKVKNKQKHTERSVFAGLSSEYDVNGISFGVKFQKADKEENKDISISAKYFYDDWRLIYPSEFRGGSEQLLPTDKRHTLSFSVTGSLNINKRMKAALTLDGVYQKGILSTPFHRVYFSDIPEAKIEILPGERIKFPIGLRYNYHLADFIILKTFNRLYVDTWGLTAFTTKIEVPIKINSVLRVYPFYRMHIQQQASYFAPYQESLSTDMFYTSDYDLSSFTSHKLGLGLSIEPLFGFARAKVPFKHRSVAMFKGIDLRFANYSRSDGLSAWLVTAGVRFEIK